MSPEVSVILPVYKADKFIKKCIQSILRQSFENFELIIVTNGSNKVTISEIETFSNPRIIRYNLDYPNLVEAVNLAISNSNGKYIARIDADDRMPPNRLEIQKHFLDQNPDYDVVSGLVHYDGDRKKYYGYYYHVKWLNQLKNHENIFLNRFVDSPVSNPSLMMRKILFDQFGLYRQGNFPEDYEMILRWLEKGIKIGKVDQKVLYWRDHPDRLTRNNENYNQDAFYRIKTQYFAQWMENSKWTEKEVLIWGTGKSVYEKSKYLTDHGIKIGGYIDIKKTLKIFKEAPVYYYNFFPENLMILSYVSDRKGRQLIHNFLIRSGYREGDDFYMMS